MNDRNILWGINFLEFDQDGEKALAHARQDGRSKADRLIEAERIKADAEATRYLAEMNCPADLIDWGRNHNIPIFAEMTWMNGFIQGWRMAVSRRGALGLFVWTPGGELETPAKWMLASSLVPTSPTVEPTLFSHEKAESA